MPLNLIQLETFRVLARERHFTRTAEVLGLTQPAVTQHVRALQEHFRVRLVDVSARRTKLTDAGKFLAARSDVVLGGVAALERDMREYADVGAGELRIGATITIGTYTLPDIVARFRAVYPAIVLRVEVENTEAIANAVRAGRVSLALVEGPLADEDLAIEPYADDELVLIVPPSHPLTRRKSGIVASELANVPFVFREAGSGTRQKVETELLAAGITADVVLTLPSGEGIVRAVALGIGVAIVSRLVAEEPVRTGSVTQVRVRGLDLRRTFRMVRAARQTPSPAALAFASLLRPDGYSLDQ